MIENGFEVPPQTLYELIGTIYRSSDAFVSKRDVVSRATISLTRSVFFARASIMR